MWVTRSENASVTPIEARANKARRTVPVGANPDSVAFSGDVAWVSHGPRQDRRIEGADGAPAAGASVDVGVEPEGISLGAQLM